MRKDIIVLYGNDDFELLMVNEHYAVKLLDSNQLVSFQSLNAAQEWLETRYGKEGGLINE